VKVNYMWCCYILCWKRCRCCDV